ncbi:MAG: glycoside hydrolase family 57 protein [Verrucomicrobiae bacterium]|nr:glycoside hydrolase family 57 protein [Verrucomicrobiae bacterium]
MLHVALLWHMHQPYYVNPLTRTALMPWVRMHAVKGYLDMIEMAKRHPEVRLVFNMTPVLVKQILELANHEVKDQWEEWTKTPAKELSFEQKRLLLENFFKANWDNLVRPHPRYHELLAKRGYDLGHISLDAIASSFSKQDFLDLQVWYNLAWCGYAACAEFPVLRELKKKGRNFSEDDKLQVLAAHRQILTSLLPRYSELAKTGRIEISTTPFYHPISPLIYDSDFAHRCMPWATLPPRFNWPADIESHLRLAIEQHEKVFGGRPEGVWPSEGSVCPELVPIWQKLGLRWFATDEEVLFKSLGRESDQPVSRAQLYDSHEAVWDGACVRGFFRDRVLSDFVGFSASRNSPQDATGFILQRIHEVVGATQGRSDPLVAVILDGENAWEYFPDGGEGFLERWYRELGNSSSWRMIRMTDYARKGVPSRKLHQLHTGSWIQANFDIWIGDPEENRGWELLGKTRAWWEKKKESVTPEVAQKVWHEIYAAEGSDWFWWYGPDFQTDNDLMFDELFRTHLQNVYLLCGAQPPEELSQCICRPTAQDNMQPPIGLLDPKIDGLVTYFFEWHEAGCYEAGQSRGAMFQGDRVVLRLFFGFSMTHFYLRLDRYPEMGSRTALALRLHFDGHEPFEYEWSPTTSWINPLNDRTRDLTQAACKRIVEIGVPFDALKLKAGDAARFAVAVAQKEADGRLVEIERHPGNGWLEFKVPDQMFAAGNWSA